MKAAKRREVRREREAEARRGGGRERKPLGRAFTQLWAASTISSVGDGVQNVALPLLAATLTRDPLAVAAVTSAEYLPWLLIGLLSGALVDRWDRRLVMWRVDLIRSLLVAGFTVAVATGNATIPLLVVTAFVLGAGQTLFDTASQAMVPAVVSQDQVRLERANGRIFGAQTITQQFIGPPAGGFLFAASASLPFGVNAASFVASASLIASIRGRYRPAGLDRGVPRSLRVEIGEGLRWLFGHRVLRTMAIMVGAANLAFMAGDAILVLFAQEKFGLGATGYGVLLATMAIGGVLGSFLAPRVAGRVGTGSVILGGLLVEAVSWGALGLMSSPWIAGGLLAVNSAAIAAWNVVGVSLRQALVPNAVMGRVVTAYRMIALGAIPLGGVVGGILARAFGLRAPFVAGAVLLALVALVSRRAVNSRTIAAARAEAVPASDRF